MVYNVEARLCEALSQGLQALYGDTVNLKAVTVVPTREGFEGEYTLVCFPWIRYATDKKVESVGEALGTWLMEHAPMVATYNVVKGFLNLTLTDEAWRKALLGVRTDGRWGYSEPNAMGKRIVIEYASPNTNKPLHLGHVRNILLGEAVASLFEARGAQVERVNLVNDRGIHICKSMVAWQRYGEGATPASKGIKGDHFVGDYYVLYDKHYRKEVQHLVEKGMPEEEAKAQAPILLEAQAMLRAWEEGDEKVRALWKTMNEWVYEGFNATYELLGVHFDRIYYESDTYLLGKSMVEEGLRKGILTKDPDGSVWADLTKEGLDRKLLLRSDGTSVYMTQDLGTAVERYNEYHFDQMVYVVGNEQDYHFQVLKILLSKFGYAWSESIYHLSYGMVFLPEGKMKSREGTVVDADDLVASLVEEARGVAEESGKLEGLLTEQAEAVYQEVGLSALKYFMSKVDPTKNMTFNPKESIDFNGNTGSFLQYTHTRACSLLERVAQAQDTTLQDVLERITHAEQVFVGIPERLLIRRLYQFAGVLDQCVEHYSPALLANYAYDLAREFNQFYHQCPILREEERTLRALRVWVVKCVGAVLGQALRLLGMRPLERM